MGLGAMGAYLWITRPAPGTEAAAAVAPLAQAGDAQAWRPAEGAPVRAGTNIPTVTLSGYGVFDGSAFSSEARALANRKNPQQLLAELGGGGAREDGAVAEALGLHLREGRVDPQGVAQALERLATATGDEARRGALRALMQAGAMGEVALTDILNSLPAGAAPQVELDLVAALAQMSPESRQAVEAVARRLTVVRDPAVQQGAVEALASMGLAGQEALRRALHDLQEQAELTRTLQRALEATQAR